jgi:hypothetical protein
MSDCISLNPNLKTNCVSQNAICKNSVVSNPNSGLDCQSNATNKSSLKKTSPNVGLKALAGLAILATSAVVYHKMARPAIIQDKVQKMFLENFTKDEGLAIQKKYKDILKIQDKDEFINKMFTELKKDYNLENIPIRIDKNFKLGEEKNGALQAAAAFTPEVEKGYFLVQVDKSTSNLDLLESMTHEMRHAKQHVLGYQALNKEEYVSIMKDRVLNTTKRSAEEAGSIAEDFFDEYSNFYNKLGITKMDKNDKNYEWARKVMESMREYANKSKEVYDTTLYETDAKQAANYMLSLIRNPIL